MTVYPKLYFMIMAKEARRFFIYRGNIFAGCITGLLMLAARYALWRALFAAGTPQNATLAETMTFFVITDLLLIWFSANYSDTIGTDIRSGDISLRLLRPFPYHMQLTASFHAGALTSTLTRALPMLTAAVIFIGLLGPVSPSAFTFFIIAAFMGWIINSLVDLIISYSAFWLTEFWYIRWFKNALFMMFGGIVLPIWFYPQWLQTVSSFLPFQFAVFVPIGIYLGRVPQSEIGFLLLMQLFWIALLFVAERALWRLAQNKIVVQGG